VDEEIVPGKGWRAGGVGEGAQMLPGVGKKGGVWRGRRVEPPTSLCCLGRLWGKGRPPFLALRGTEIWKGVNAGPEVMPSGETSCNRLTRISKQISLGVGSRGGKNP